MGVLQILMVVKQARKWERANQTRTALRWLAARYPVAFPDEVEVVHPLAMGIRDAVLAAGAAEPDALQQAGCAILYEESASGKNTERPELNQCRKALRAGDTLVVWRLDRLGRSLSDLVRLVADLEQRGVHFESLTEKIDTGSAAGKLQFHVFASLAEFERALIRERTQAGLAAARACRRQSQTASRHCYTPGRFSGPSGTREMTDSG